MISSVIWLKLKYSLPPTSKVWLIVSGTSNAQIRQVTISSTHSGWSRVLPRPGRGRKPGAMVNSMARPVVKLSCGPKRIEARRMVWGTPLCRMASSAMPLALSTGKAEARSESRWLR